MLDALLQLDQKLFLYLNGLGSPAWDGFWMAVTNKFTAIPLYFLLLVVSYRFFGLKKTLWLCLAIALMITVTDQLSNFFKLGVQRLRPCHELSLQPAMRLVKGYCGGKFGYYSAHASNSMAVAFFFTVLLGKNYRLAGPLLILWALAVAYSRIYIGVHYPLDVVSGALAGLLIGWLFARLYTLALKRFRL